MRLLLTSRKKTQRRVAISLLEILFVMSFLGLLITYGLNASTHFIHSARLKNAAEQLVTSLNEARAQAIRHRQPVRVLFSLPSPEENPPNETNSKSNDKKARPRGVALVRFVIPADCDQFHQMQAPTAALEGGQALKSRKTEWLLQQGGPRPQALVGQWVAVGQPHHWDSLPEEIIIKASFLEKAKLTNPKEYLNDHGWTPPDCWGEPSRQANRRRLKHWQSAYPESYGLTPYPLLAPPVSTTFSNDEVFPATNPKSAPVKVRDVYGPQPRPHFPREVLEQSPPEFFPYIEFGPDGRLMTKETSEVRWELQIVGHSEMRYEIVIPADIGPIRIEGRAETRTRAH